MNGKQLIFYTVKEDIEEILEEIEKSIDIKYCKSGMFNNINTPYYHSIIDSPNFGHATSKDWNRIDNYLVMKKDELLKVESIPQRKGGILYAVDPLLNTRCISIKIGGTLIEDDNIIIAGSIGTSSVDDFSISIYKLFTSKIKKKFKKIGAFYVSKIAEKKIKEGCRLVTNADFSKEYDLAIQ